MAEKTEWVVMNDEIMTGCLVVIAAGLSKLVLLGIIIFSLLRGGEQL